MPKLSDMFKEFEKEETKKEQQRKKPKSKPRSKPKPAHSIPQPQDSLSQTDAKQILREIRELKAKLELKEKKEQFNRENLIEFIKEKGTTKPYEVRIKFKAPVKEITDLMHTLLKEGILKRSKNGWYSLK